jgi:hypothetical protein
MKRPPSATRALTFALAAAALVVSRPVRADLVDGNVRVRVEFLDTETSVYGRVAVTAVYHFPIQGDLTLSLDGNTIKLDPIDTSNTQYSLAYLGPLGGSYSICGSFEGESWLGGDNYRSGFARDCKVRLEPAPASIRPPARTPFPSAPPIRRDRTPLSAR